jgi:hypothetical protein
MYFSAHSLHSPVIERLDHKTLITERFLSMADNQRQLMQQVAGTLPGVDSLEIPLTTVSLDSNFDAYINIGFRGETSGPTTSLLLDSGNSTLIVPSWEDIAALPNSGTDYTVLGTCREPWGSPAKIVRGPIEIPTTTGHVYSLENCVFYACLDAPRTANFGVGCLRPWSANGWNTVPGTEVTMQAPLSYNALYPYAVFDYAAANSVLAGAATPNIAEGSSLVLFKSAPSGYVIFDIIPDLEWMSLIPRSLSIGNTKTGWPGTVDSPIAMIDTGGGPVFLSDPNGYVYKSVWPASTGCPTWTTGSADCQCTGDAVTIELGDGNNSISYVIDSNRLPPSVRGLTLVMCRVNSYMWGQQGMNIGGVSALFNYILIDYLNGRVGLRPK